MWVGSDGRVTLPSGLLGLLAERFRGDPSTDADPSLTELANPGVVKSKRKSLLIIVKDTTKICLGSHRVRLSVVISRSHR